jgi:methyl-accepting chemotaxis protein
MLQHLSLRWKFVIVTLLSPITALVVGGCALAGINALAQGVSANAAHAARLEVGAAGLLVSVISLILGWYCARSVVAPISLMAFASGRLAKGNLNRDIPQSAKAAILRQTNELGALGAGLAGTESYLTEMSAVAEHIADGDLTVNVTPRSDEDELGHTFVRMLAALRELVGQIASSAAQVASASEQLASAAEQSGEATGQVTTTIQQVAQGAASQASSTTEVTGSMDEIARRVEEIARGAAAQAESVRGANQAMGQLQGQVGEAGQAAETTAAIAEQVARSARTSASTVQSTVRSIEVIAQSANLVA